MRWKWIAPLAISAAFMSPQARAQSVMQSGLVTPGHSAAWRANGVIGDGGGSSAPTQANQGAIFGGLNVLGGACVEDGYNNLSLSPHGYYQACLFPNSLGGGLFSYQSNNGASPLNLNFNINGNSVASFGATGAQLLQEPTATTPDPSDTSTRIATTAYVQAAIGGGGGGPIPFAASNAALQALSTASVSKVVRGAFAVSGDAPWQAYTSAPPGGGSAVACPLNGGNGDNGYQVKSADNKCWFAIPDPAGMDIREWGAKFDGSTDDSAAWQAAATSGVKAFIAPAGKTSLAANVTFGAGTVLDCQMANVNAPTGSTGKWVIKRTGAVQTFRNCNLGDPNNYTMVSTRLGSNASAGSTNITVASASNLAIGMPIVITLDSGIEWPTKITNIVGTTVTILDAIPNSATGVSSIGAGGSGASTNDALVAIGGTGLNAPLTLAATASAGGVTAATIKSPGLYTTVPSNPITVQNTTSVRSSGTTVNINWGGASSGNAVQAAWGVLTSDGAVEGTTSNVIISGAPVAFAWLNGGSQSEGEKIHQFQANAVTMISWFQDVDVNTMSVSDGRLWGTVGQCAVGGYINSESPGGFATGGNNYNNVIALQCGIGWLLQSAQLDIFVAGQADTLAYYGWILNNTFNTQMSASYATVAAASGDYGVGIHVGNNSVNVALGAIQAGRNAADLNVGDGTNSVFLDQLVGVQGVGRKITGFGTGIFSGQQILARNYGTVSTSGTPVYLGDGQSATETGVQIRTGLYASTITNVEVTSNTAPGMGHTFTAVLRIAGADSPLTCSYSGAAAFGCDMFAPMQLISNTDSGFDAYDVSLTSDTALSSNFWVTIKAVP